LNVYEYFNSLKYYNFIEASCLCLTHVEMALINTPLFQNQLRHRSTIPIGTKP